MKKSILAILLIAILDAGQAFAVTLKELRRFPKAEQGTYIGAAVSMLAYTYAANGDPVRARCTMNWYFGKGGAETPGPREIAVEIGVAEADNPEKYHVEGLILGLTEKACPASPTKPKP